MRITKTQMQETEVLVQVICNKCGGHAHLHEHFSTYYSGGYDSILGDMAEYKFDLCEACLCDFMDTFKIPAKVIEEDID